MGSPISRGKGRFFNVFLPIKTTHLLHWVFSSSDLKHMTSFWFKRLFMDHFSCLLVVRKKYANTYGKDSKYTNAIDISITGSFGGGAGGAAGRGCGSVGRAGSFIACIASISATLFCII